jgi:tetrahydromethanopterin S-methyltransferase subunit H
MFKFQSPQQIYRIGDVEIGGHPGQRPTVMVGSIFFQKHCIVSDPRKGTFDEGKARALLEREGGRPIFEAGSAAVFTLPQSFGADYVFYRPIRNAPWAYAAGGIMDAMLAYNSRNLGYRLACDTHPLHQIV